MTHAISTQYIALKNKIALGLFLTLIITAQTLLTPQAMAAEKSSADNSGDSSKAITILTALPVTYFLSSALVADTTIQVKNLPKRGRRLNGQENYFTSKKAKNLAKTFNSATAVVTIGKLWRDDPLFTAARSANIRIVEIDATKPWSRTLEGISVAMTPAQDTPWETSVDESAHGVKSTENTPSVFFWLSLMNSARSAEIIAEDLMRLVPGEAPTIKSNLTKLHSKLMELQRRNELAMLNAADITVFSLAPELIYLTSEQNLFVDGSFYKQDIEWTSADTVALEKHLKDNKIGVVLHKWQPAESILNAIKAAGAKLVVIETLDAGIVKKGSMLPESYLTLMEENLENLRAVFIE